MKKAFIIIAVAVISALSLSSCSKANRTATKIICTPSSITLGVGETKSVDFALDGDELPSGRTMFNVAFYIDESKKDLVSVEQIDFNTLEVKGLKSGSLKITGVVIGDPADEKISGSFDVTIR